MRTTPLLLAAILLAMSGCVSMPLSPAEEVTASLAPLSRPDLSLHRAPGKPSVALNLAAFGQYGEGEVFEGGEIDEILSQFNGPPPKLELDKSAHRDGSSKGNLEAQPADTGIGHVHYHPSPSGDMKLGADSLDGALMVMPYGKFFDRSSDKGKPADDPGKYIEQIVTALKPGAVLVVLDQKADPGPGDGKSKKAAAEAKPLRAEDFKAHGLDFIGTIPAASRPDGDAGKKSPDPAAPAKPRTERVFDLYRKPDPDPGAALPP